MKVTAKCRNYAGCLRAYRGEDIELEPDAARVCPECGQPVTVSRTSSPLVKIGGIVLALVALAAGIFFALPHLRRPAPDQPAQSEVVEKSEQPQDAPPEPEPAIVSAGVAEPPDQITAPERLDMSTTGAENRKVKEEVLKRIDLMPNVSQNNKDKLYNSVERARSMGKVLTIPFASGRSAIAAADVDLLRKHLESPELLRLRDDPTAVFVVLGYADPIGNQEKNLAISQQRADSVLTAMRDKCGVVNVLHAVAMGGSTLLDAQNLEKNRIVEVWAVLP